MRAALALLVLALACGPVHAQAEKEAKKSSKGHTTVSKDSQPPKGKPSPAAKQQNQKFDTTRPQDQRARERVPGDPPPDHRKHTVSKDSQPPKGPASPAIQFQQEQLEKRNVQARKGLPEDKRSVGCSANPVCSRGGGSCQGVVRNYGTGSVAASKSDIISACISVNTPDPCDCARQCARVARCSTF